jgi:excisionase family DNA binding protein
MAKRDDLMTIPQAATVLAMHRAAVFRAVQAGRLPAVKVGGVWVLRRADVEAYRDTPRPRGGRPRKALTTPPPDRAQP